LNSEEKLLETLLGGDCMSSIDFVESAKIDSTHLSVDETVARALEIIQK
jgi:hypothetical protein